MILASIGSNYSLETNSLSVCHRKYLLKYLAVDGCPDCPASAGSSAGYIAGKRG